MRSLILILALALAAIFAEPACKSGGDTAAGPQVVPGAPAGDVTELSGDVHATRAGATRALAAHDVVSGDDLIATGADGRVVIVLRHNQVAWSLGPNKAKKVGDSAAWAAAKGARAPDDVTDDHSAAAGRHAERSATDTAASTGAGSAGSASGSDDLAAKKAELEQQLAQDEAERRAASERLEEVQQDRVDVAERIAAAQKAAERAERLKGVKISKECLDNPLATGCDDDGASDQAPGSGDVEGSIDPAVIRRVMHMHAAAFRACYQTLLKSAPGAKGKLTFHIRIEADGKVSRAGVDGDAPLAPMFDCARKAAATLVFPTDTAALNVTYPMTFAP